MRIDRIAVNRLATTAKQGNLPGVLTKPEPAETLLGWVLRVDPGRNEVTVQLNDHEYPVVPGIPVRQSGGAADMPAAGDLVQLEYVGQELQVVGRQYRPIGAVTFQ